jgi:hypothetical protein
MLDPGRHFVFSFLFTKQQRPFLAGAELVAYIGSVSSDLLDETPPKIGSTFYIVLH